jgi:hypothetical protein
VEEFFVKAQLSGATPLGMRLEDLVNGMLIKVERSPLNPPKKANFLIITDGVPSELSQSMQSETH